MEDRCQDDEELARQMQEEIDRERDAYMKNDKRIARMIDEMQKKNRVRSWHCIHGGQPHVHSEMARVASPVVATCTDGVTAEPGDGTDGGQGTEVGTHPHLLKARVIDFRQVQQRGR